MPRVMHWIQNKTIQFYPSAEIRQIWCSPFAEYIILHFQILCKSDRFANLAQWISMLLSCASISLITQFFGAKRKTQIISSFIAATIPMGILQSSSTQNDYVVSCFILISIYFLLKSTRSFKKIDFLFTGISAGLAILTKGTAYIFLCPFILYAFFIILKKSLKTMIIAILIIGSSTLLINGTHYYRNYKLGKNPVSPVDNSKYLQNKSFSPKSLLSNMLRNTGLNVYFPSKKLNESFNNLIENTHKKLNIDLLDNRTTFANYKFEITNLIRHEDYAPNPLHLLLFLLSILALPFTLKRNPKKRMIMSYLILCVCSFIIFSLLLKWQPWGNRLMLPFYLLITPIIALSIGATSNFLLLIIITLPLFLYAIPVTLKNSTKKIIMTRASIFNLSRNDKYFYANPGIRYSYLAISNNLVSIKATKIGLAIGGESWEYPFWPLLKPFENNIRIEHTKLTPESPKIYPLGKFTPDTIITKNESKFSFKKNKENYIKWRSYGQFSLFLKDSDGRTKEKILFNNFYESMKNASFYSRINKIPKELRIVIRDLQFQISNAKTVNPNDLNNVMDGLGEKYRNLLVLGLEMRFKGMMSNKKKLFIKGQSLIDSWLFWYTENKEIISKSFIQHYPYLK